jgi:hypothetical protein
MALDEILRRQLIEARENIGAQLTQLEGAAMGPYSEGGMADCRKLYADLQRELHEIDTLLEAAGDDLNVSDEPKSSYQPMIRWNPDGTVGNPTGPTRPAIIWAIFGLGSFALWIAFVLIGR